MNQTLRIPSPFELAELVDKVLGDWAFLSARPAGKPAQGPAPFPLEYSVRPKGRHSFLLNLRCNHSFAAELAQASTGDPGARAHGEDAFRELCNLLASHLMSSLGSPAGRSFESFLPEPSTPASWPSRLPDSQSVIIADRFPLEIRLWVDGAGNA
jgi:hypothetical protein